MQATLAFAQRCFTKHSTYALTCHRKDEPTWQHIQDWQRNAQQESPYRNVCIPHLSSDDRQAEEEAKGQHVPPIRHLGVVAHKLRVYIILFDFQVLEAIEQ